MAYRELLSKPFLSDVKDIKKDKVLLGRLHKKMDEILKNPERIVEGTETEHDFYTKTKGRVLDPKFFAANALKRLSDVDSEFKQRAEAFKSNVEKGYITQKCR